MKLDYNSREIFFGNEALIVADMAKGSNGKPEFTNHKIVTGLVSVGEMEDQAETNLSLIHIWLLKMALLTHYQLPITLQIMSLMKMML